MEKIKVAVADDEALFCSFLNDFLNLQEDMACICQASNGAALIEKINALTSMPDVFILDMNMPGPENTQVMKGGEATARALQAKY